MASTYLTWTPSSSGNRKTFTFSFWCKRGDIGTSSGNTNCMYNQHNSSNDYNSFIGFNSNDTFKFWDYTTGYTANIGTNAKYRDVNSWYNFVVAVDTTQSTASDRVKIYVNGVQETSLASSSYPSQNLDLRVNEYQAQQIGVYRYGSSSNYHFNGTMSYVAFIEGTQELPGIFGETDSTTGEWKIKTTITPSVAWGTNGYLILKDGNTITDSSSNSNNFSLGAGTLTKTEDNPSNVFATFNSLHNYFEGGTYAYGNNQITTGGSNKYTWNNSTIGMEVGKYYAEFKWVSGGTDILFGLTDKYTSSSTGELGNYDKQYAYRTNGTVRNNNGDLSGWSGSSWTTGDVVGVAYDATNGKLYFSKNGTWQNSGDPTSGSTGTGAISVSASPQDGCYYFSSCGYDDASCVLQANFGNGYFGTTAVSSAGTNASNNGIFEFDCPTGYTALSTKGLNL